MIGGSTQLGTALTIHGCGCGEMPANFSLHHGADGFVNAGPDAWQDPEEALGLANGPLSVAASPGQVSVITDYDLHLTYPDQHPAWAPYTISNPVLHFYVRAIAGFTNGQMDLYYDVGAGWQLLESISGDFDNLSTPRAYSLAGILTTWAHYDALQTRVRHRALAVLQPPTGELDAVELTLDAAL